MTLQKWIPTTNLMHLRRLGKFGEELGELSAVTNRCIIQGIDEIDPSSGKTNRRRLEEEIADVITQCECTMRAFNLDTSFVGERANKKLDQMEVWEAMFEDEQVTEGG